MDWDRVYTWMMQYTNKNEVQFRILDASDSEEDSGLEELIDTVTSFKKSKTQSKSPIVPRSNSIKQII